MQHNISGKLPVISLLQHVNEGRSLVERGRSLKDIINTVEIIRKLDIFKVSLVNLKNVVNGLVNETITSVMSKLQVSIKTHPLRNEYENKVKSLAQEAEKLIIEGKTPEETAKTITQMRRSLSSKYKDATPFILRSYIYAINTKRYNDPLGPSFEFLLDKYKGDYVKIINAASRPNPDINALLGGYFKKWFIGKLQQV